MSSLLTVLKGNYLFLQNVELDFQTDDAMGHAS